MQCIISIIDWLQIYNRKYNDLVVAKEKAEQEAREREEAERLAKQTGAERVSARAVGGAVGRNPVSLIIPCHRIVGADGSLTGYAGGIDRKRKLLEMEGIR